MTNRTRPLPLLLALSFLAGCGDETPVSEASLVVTVRTDYAPGEEFTGVVARLGTTRREVVARRMDNYAAGVDLPAFEGLPGGTTVDLDVELIDADGVVARRAVAVSLDEGGRMRVPVVIGRTADPPDGGVADGGPGEADAGPDDAGPYDAGAPDAGPPPTAPVGYGDSRDSLTVADFACRGSVTAPSEMGADADFDVEIQDFQSSNPIEGLAVDVFADDEPSAGCGPGCVRRLSDATGTIPANDVAGSWFAYRINAGVGIQAGVAADYVQMLGYHLAAPMDGARTTVFAIQDATIRTIEALLGLSEAPGTADLAGYLTDCEGEPIANATVRVFDASGEIPLGLGATGPRAYYFTGGLPGVRETSTNVDGLFGAANVPVPMDGRLRVELWGRTSAGDPPSRLACEAVEVVADGLTLLNVGPLRADGPMACAP